MKVFKTIIIGTMLLITLLMSSFSLYLHFYGGVFKYQYLNWSRPLTIEKFFDLAPIDSKDDYLFDIRGYLIKGEGNRLYLVSKLETLELSNNYSFWNKLRIRYPIEKINEKCFGHQVLVTGKYFPISGAPNIDEIFSIVNIEKNKTKCMKKPYLQGYNHFCFTNLIQIPLNKHIQEFCKNKNSQQIQIK